VSGQAQQGTGQTPGGPIRACVFDAYGTLFDLSTACARLRAQLQEREKPLAALWRDKQVQYSWWRTLQGRHVDFEGVTRDALAHALDALHLDVGLEAALMAAFNALEAYPEVPGVLRRLRAMGLTTAILSNGSPSMLAALVQNAGIGALLDHVLSVEDVGVFKPDPRVYALAVERLGVPAQQISFQSSNAWDAHAAASFGMRVVWCNRQGQAVERLPGRPAFTVASLQELPELLAHGA